MMPFADANKLMTKEKKCPNSLMRYTARLGIETVTFLDKIKDLGFHYATRAGVDLYR